jgi:hypothetical protein
MISSNLPTGQLVVVVVVVVVVVAAAAKKQNVHTLVRCPSTSERREM